LSDGQNGKSSGERSWIVGERNRNRILVVEDNEALGQVCALVLSAEGFQVDTATTGEMALDRMKDDSYALCLVDIRMPGMDGMELFKHMKQESPELADRVVFTTGDATGTRIQTFLKQTGRPCLIKPFTLKELRVVARSAFGDGQVDR